MFITISPVQMQISKPKQCLNFSFGASWETKFWNWGRESHVFVAVVTEKSNFSSRETETTTTMEA